MSVWQQKTADIQEKINRIFNELQASFGNINMMDMIDTIGRREITNIIKTGGLSRSLLAQNELNAIFGYLQRIENEIILPLQKRLRDESKNLDMTGQLGNIGKIQQEIMDLKDQLRLAKEDADNQVVRDTVLRTADSAVSKHQLFLFGRPIHQESIPYLWKTAAFFFFIGIAILILMVPSFTPQENMFGIGSLLTRARNSSASLFSQNMYGPSITEQFMSIFGNPWVIGSTVLSLVIVVTVLLLKIRGTV
jgi:hypothetical protein